MEISRQDLGEFARRSSLDVIYSETSSSRDGTGFVECETSSQIEDFVVSLASKMSEFDIHGGEIWSLQKD
jgi:hypothetical protein